MTEHESNYQTPRSALYAPIGVGKFIVLYVATFGVYSLLWFYRNWRYVKRRDDSAIWPIPRALFSHLMYFALLSDLKAEDDIRPLSSGLALAFLMLAFAWQMPDPYYWIGALGFLPLLPAVRAINELNREAGVPVPPSGRWRLRNLPVVLGGGALVMVGALSSFLVIPSTRVLTGDEIPDAHIQYFRDVGLVAPDEEVLSFYSPALLSIRPEGAVLTDRGVAVYWTDLETGERLQGHAAFSEITGVEVEWSSNEYLIDSTVRVHLNDGSSLEFMLSAEEGGDREFVDELERRRR